MHPDQALRLRARLLVIGLVLLSLSLGIGTWILIRAMAPERGDVQSLSVFGSIPPETQLVANTGETVRLGDFGGNPLVVNFIFTRCQGTCPLLSSKMARLVKTLHEEDIRFVSITVDPAFDTPEVLNAYARKYEADPARWVFLTGSDSTIRHLSVDIFKLPMMEGTDPKEPIIHSSRLMLVDGDGRIRGYYDALDQNGLPSMVEDVHRLIKEG